MLDILNQPPEKQTEVDYSHYTLPHYILIVRNKTCYYTFFLPLALGLAVTGDLGRTVSELQLKEVSYLIGEYFQIKDDILDCFADPAHIGKIGTDIQDNKCSWLAAQFLSKGTPQQIIEFKENYGKHDDECVQKIKQLYKDLDMEEIFAECEADYARKVNFAIAQFTQTCPVLHAALTQLWKVTYKRTK
jgi:farnesyl diphosphate synthase